MLVKNEQFFDIYKDGRYMKVGKYNELNILEPSLKKMSKKVKYLFFYKILISCLDQNFPVPTSFTNFTRNGPVII